jgi:ribosomal protein L11 methyltransferase
MAESGLWFEITASVRPADIEAVSELMRRVSPQGITVEEPFDALGPEMGFKVRRGEPVAVRAYLPSSELGAVLTQQLRESMVAFPDVELIARPIYEQDWEVAWRDFFGTVEVGRVTIVPSWIDHEAEPSQVIIRLDPGRAFGTGHHETTRLCLHALQDAVRPGCSVLDVGTGSGILAVAAAKLGAGLVDGVDIDPIAIGVARENCAANDLKGSVSLRAGALDADSIEHRYDVVVANISSQANTALAPVFAANVADGGRLILSGVLSSDARAVRAAMEAEAFHLTAMRHESDWSLSEFGPAR